MRSYTKSELAALAGVSLSTFSRWLRRHAEQLTSLGVMPKAHLLNPRAVRYVCDLYGIDLL